MFQIHAMSCTFRSADDGCPKMPRVTPPKPLVPTIGFALFALLNLGAALRSETVDFATSIAPLLQDKCLHCHQPGNRKGDISLATSDDLSANEFIVAGRPDESYLIQLVSPQDGQPPEMPKEGEPLSNQQVAVLRQWIAQGADWPPDVVLRQKFRADDSWWSLQPLVRVQPPSGGDAPERWRRNPIDRFVYAKLRETGLRPSVRADRRALVRRATYDLTGLPPTLREVVEFVADKSPAAYERLIDRLLASPRYGEHWGRHWLDVVRFGESRGFERNEIINNAWAFRDYVIRSFNDDKPFDQLLREHLAGDVIGPGIPSIEVGTTFLVCGPYDDVGNQDASQAAQIRANTIDEMIRATSEAFLGLTIGCARCHDHKFDPVQQRDYYALYATFAGVHHGSRVVATEDASRQRQRLLAPLSGQRDQWIQKIAASDEAITGRIEQRAAEITGKFKRAPIQRTGTEEKFHPVITRFVRLVVEGTESTPQARTGYRIDEFEIWSAEQEPRNVALAIYGSRASGSSRVANDFSEAYSASLTIDGLFGARWLATTPELTIALSEPHSIDRVFFSSDRTGDAGDHRVANFVSEYRIEVSLDGERWTEVANSHDRKAVNAQHRRQRQIALVTRAADQMEIAKLKRKLAEVDRRIRELPPLPEWWVGNFQPAPGPFHIFIGGDPQRKGPEVVPASLQVLQGSDVSYTLSADASDGQRRRSLADWIASAANPLTSRVLANRLWHYHFGRGIVQTPSNFGYLGGRPSHPALLDWLATELLRQNWRLKPIHRQIMLSECYQQASFSRAEAATIDTDSRFLWRFPPRRLSAEEIRDTILCVTAQLDGSMGGPGFRLYRYLQDNVATYEPLDEHGPETYRRGVYHQNARASRVDMMTDFDCPDNSFAAPRRARTTTPMQALTMMNHKFSLDMAKFLAARVRRETTTEDVAAEVRLAIALVYAREPFREELPAASELITAHGLPAFCRALLNSSEFIYID